MQSDKSIILTPQRILKFNFCVIGILFIMHCIFLYDFRFKDSTDLNRYAKFFLFDYENNLPTIYSALMLFISSALSLYIPFIKEIKKTQKSYWILITIIFAFLSLDEWKMIHERMNEPVSLLIYQQFKISIAMSSAWTYMYAILAILFGLIFAVFTFKLPEETRNLFIISFSLFVAGSIGMEFLTVQFLGLVQQNTVYLLTHTMEELLEMSGIAIFNYALIKYILRYRNFYITANLNSR